MEFEERIALDKKSETSLILGSGFQTNVTVLSTLLDKTILGVTPIVFMDRLNHNSLYQGVLTSGAEYKRYAHNDLSHLSLLLNEYKNDPRPKFIVTETIFGMDGDILQIEELVDLARQHNVFLYLDEAHATGVFGRNGYGLSTKVDFTNLEYVFMGTFSKALGSFGSYIACSNVIKAYLLNKSAGIIYSTSLSPLNVGAAYTAWKLLGTMDSEREKLLQLSNSLRSRLVACGFNVGASESNIIPILVGSETTAMEMQNYLYNEKILVSCVRPPSVPNKTSRLRLALNIHHSEDDCNRLISALEKM